MKLNRTPNPLDRNARNGENDNWEKIEGSIKRIDDTVSDLVLESGGDSNLEVVQARGGKPVLNDRLVDIETELADYEEEINFVKNTKMDKNTTDISFAQINKNKKLLDESYLSDELKQQMAGNAPVNATPPDGSVTNIKLADKAVSVNKTEVPIQSTVKQLYAGKHLFKSMLTEPIIGDTTNSFGWATKFNYFGEEITGAKVFVPLITNNGEIKFTIRKGTDINEVILESKPQNAVHSGYYTVIFDETVNQGLINEDSFYLAVESVGRTDNIYNSGESGEIVITDRVDLDGLYQLTTSGSWYKLSRSLKYPLSVEFFGMVNLDNKVDNDVEYKSIKETIEYSQTANKLFYTRNDEISLSSYVGNFFGWATPFTYLGERISSAKIHLNMDSFDGDVISRITDTEMNTLTTSLPVSPKENGWYTFIYENDVKESSGTLYLTIESVGRQDRILEASDKNVSGENRLAEGNFKYLSRNGNWVDVSTTSKYAIHAIFSNNNVSEAISKIKQPISSVIETVEFPNKFYTVANDIDYDTPTERHYALPIYSEYLTNNYHDLRFENNQDRFYLLEEKTSDDVTIKEIDVTFSNGEYTSNKKTINQVITKASVPNKKAFVLTIGDSVTYGANSSNRQYWKVANELFEKESIDFNRDNNVVFVGTAQKRQETEIYYKDVQRTIYSSAEGRSGWDGLSYFRYSTVRRPNQETWDALGLGDGSGNDYTGSEEQKELIQKTCEVNDSETPSNPFFDNDKTGNNRFSISKWLERYRTLDDNGDRLTLGDGTGSKINANNLNEIDVCTPTHVVLAFGHNDIAFQGIEAFEVYMKEWIAEIKSQLPNVIILVVLSIPRIGLWNNGKYPNYQGTSTPYNLDKYITNVENWVDYFRGYNEVNNKTFLLPQFFVTPSAESYQVIEHADGSGNKSFKVIGDDLHPGYKAHANWGYQLYSLLKYTMTIN